MTDENNGTERSPIVERIRLGRRLRQLRENAGLTREEAGGAIRGSGTKVTRLESGRLSFRPRDVADLLDRYGVSGGVRDELLAMVERANQPGWWRQYADQMPSWLQHLVALEEVASRIQTYEPRMLPGLLQTKEYAHAVISTNPEAAGSAVDHRVRLRMRRQRILLGPHPTKLWALIDEAVLRRKVGGRDVMRRQVEHLLDLSQVGGPLTIQVVPFSVGHYSAEHAFSLLRFSYPEVPDICYVEKHAGAEYLEKLSVVESFAKIVHRLGVEAEQPEVSRRRLRALAADPVGAWP
jgi:hypothetical protein